MPAAFVFSTNSACSATSRINQRGHRNRYVSSSRLWPEVWLSRTLPIMPLRRRASFVDISFRPLSASGFARDAGTRVSAPSMLTHSPY
tara:strand:+ start:1400 stop:1663 length:264 start_codon:yes stop_codon:yes gene_type:complete